MVDFFCAWDQDILREKMLAVSEGPKTPKTGEKKPRKRMTAEDKRQKIIVKNQAIYDVVKNADEPPTMARIVEITGIPATSMQRYLVSLRQRGILRSSVPKGTRRHIWEVVP